MTFHKNKKAIAKAVTLGMVATSIVPTVVTNENVYAEKNTLTAGNKKETKVVKVTSSSLNVRDGAGTNHHIQGTVSRGNTLEYISTCNNGWYKVRYKGKIGYVSNDYSKVVGKLHTTTNNNKDSITKVGKVTGSSLKVRKGPSTKYSVKKTLKNGSVVGIITSYRNGWAKVKLSNSLTGYVNKNYLHVYNGNSRDIDVHYINHKENSSSNNINNKKISKVLSTLKSKVGKPYIYGAAGPNSFDCSGLTYYCYKQVGIYLNRSALDQSRNGRHVSKSNLKPGDLIFFNSGTNRIRHVGMYIGNNKFIHSPSPGKKVRYESLSTSYYVKGYMTARRIID